MISISFSWSLHLKHSGPQITQSLNLNAILKPFAEGLDFIETEEDVKAVEAATLKIQSTFRGKKIRSKLTPTKASDDASSGAKSEQAKEKEKEKDKKEAVQVNKSAGQQQTSSKSSSTTATTTSKPGSSETELSKRIGEMQVNDNNNEEEQPQVSPVEVAAENTIRLAWSRLTDSSKISQSPSRRMLSSEFIGCRWAS